MGQHKGVRLRQAAERRFWPEEFASRITGGGRVPVAFSPDSRILAFEAGLGVIALADTETGKELTRMEHPDQAIANALAFTPDGSSIVAGTTVEQAIFAWDLRAIAKELKGLHLTWDVPLAHASTRETCSYSAIIMTGERFPQELSEDIVLEAENVELTDRVKSPTIVQLMTSFRAHRWSNDRQLFCVCEQGGHVDCSVKWPGTR
jgi:hypothetical protein